MVHIEADATQRMGKKVDGHEMLDMQWFTFESDGISLQGWFEGPWQVNDEDRYALLVVDSIMGGFRVDYSGRGELADRQQKLAKVMNKLQKAGFRFPQFKKKPWPTLWKSDGVFSSHFRDLFLVHFLKC